MKQIACSEIKKAAKIAPSGQQTRRSMILRQQNPPAIHEPNIEDILALQLSDTLINAAYNLSVTKITVGIQKLSNPLELLFLQKKLFAFQNIRIYSNRTSIIKQISYNRNLSGQTFQQNFSLLTQIDLLKQQSLIKGTDSQLIVLTKQQQIEKVKNTIVTRLSKMNKIINTKLAKTKCQTLTKLQTYSPSIQQPKQALKNSIQQTFQKYQQTRNNNNSRHFHRRSIDKQPPRKSSNQLTYSLNKNHYEFNRIKSPQRNTKSKNLLYNYGRDGNTDKKASTCSQTQSNNSQKESQSMSREYYYTQTGKSPTQSNSIINRLKPKSPTMNSPYQSSKINESRISSVLLNGSYFAQGTKQRELEILRNKYFRLVEEFKDFSERFLQVIKEE